MQPITHVILGQPPAPLRTALSVIGERLYGLTAKTPIFRDTPDRIATSCVFLSLVVCDTLRQAGFTAEPRPCALAVEKRGVHQLVIGNPTDKDANAWSWAGHLIVCAEGVLIDPSLGQARRPEWPRLPDIAAAPLFTPPRDGSLDNRPMPLLSAMIHAAEGFRALWFDTPENTRWIGSPDTQPDRRRRLADKLSLAIGAAIQRDPTRHRTE